MSPGRSGGMRLAVVGNPANRRVRMFTEAAVAAGLPPPAVTTWRDVAAGGGVPAGPDAVRVDSPGEDAEVDRLLRGAPRQAEHGEIVGMAAAYRGLTAAVSRLADAGLPLLTSPADVAAMCDKRVCHALLDAAGVPVPPSVPGVDGWETLRASGARRVFVKSAHGSSASGVLAVAFGSHGRVVAYTTVERAGGRLYNSLRVRRYDREADVAAIVDALAPDGLHVERWLPKAGLDGCVVDLRVVVVAGRPTHVVVRASPGPLTNLHLGNARGDLAAVRAAVGEPGWAAAMGTCARAAACFRSSLHVGVDLLLTSGWREHAVAEVNAFGDLLPGVLSASRDTYAEEVDALVSGRFDTWRRGGTRAGAGADAPARPGRAG